MLRKNMIACVQDTREGVRRPHKSTSTPPGPASKATGRSAAAATGPYPALCSPSEDTIGPRRPTQLGTVNTPVAVAHF